MLITYDLLVEIKKNEDSNEKDTKYEWHTRDFRQNTLMSLIFKNNIIHTNLSVLFKNNINLGLLKFKKISFGTQIYLCYSSV